MSRKLLCVFLLFTINIFAQNQGNLSGIVIDSETGFGLEGATIQIQNSDFYTITDQNGNFKSSFNFSKSYFNIIEIIFDLTI